jgi:hypothetical protein
MLPEIDRMTSRFSLTALLFLTVIGLVGCATEQKTAKEDEYVTLPPKTGSHLPRRVKKSDLLAGKVPDADAAQEVDKDQFKQSIRPGMKSGTP